MATSLLKTPAKGSTPFPASQPVVKSTKKKTAASESALTRETRDFEEFAAKAARSQDRPLELIDEFAELCALRLSHVRESLSERPSLAGDSEPLTKGPSNPVREAREKKGREEALSLDEETKAWSFLSALLRDRTLHNGVEDEVIDPKLRIEESIDRATLAQRLLRGRRDLRELNILKLWLEEGAVFEVKGRVIAVDAKGEAPGSNRKEVELLCKEVWLLVRAGLTDKACELAKNSGQEWRVPLIQAHLFRSDPHLTSPSLSTPSPFPSASTSTPFRQSNNPHYDETLPVRPSHNNNNIKSHSDGALALGILGGDHMPLFRDIATRVTAAGSKLNPYEKALMALQAGLVDPILPLCSTWEDVLWAHVSAILNAKLRLAFEPFEPSPAASSPSQVKASQPFANFPLAEAFDRIANSSNFSVKESFARPFPKLLKLLVLDDLDLATSLLAEWASLPSASAQQIRFAAHFVLLMADLNIFDLNEFNDPDPLQRSRVANSRKILLRAIEHIVEEQRSLLRSEKPHTPSDMTDLAFVMAHFTSRIPLEVPGDLTRISAFSKFLSLVQGKASRADCLNIASEFNLDANELAKEVVRMTTFSVDEDASVNTSAQNSETDDVELSVHEQRRIAALEWLCYSFDQRFDAILYTNALIRAFLLMDRVSAAQEALALIVSHLPNLNDDVKRFWLQTRKYAGEENALREFTALRGFLEAQQIFHQWLLHIESRPTDPFADAVPLTVEEQQSLSLYREAQRQWQHHHEVLSPLATDLLRQVLFFKGGFLIDAPDPIPELETRPSSADHLEESTKRLGLLQQLRVRLIPIATAQLQQIYLANADHKASLQLVTEVASSEYKLFECFTKDQMRGFLKNLRPSTLHHLAAERHGHTGNTSPPSPGPTATIIASTPTKAPTKAVPIPVLKPTPKRPTKH